MSHTLTFGSSFAGIGGFDLGFERAGLTPKVQVEWKADRSEILAAHWPTVARKGDIRDVSGTDIAGVDIWGGGFPCQDTSIAAPHRAGLAGARSSMFWEWHRVLDEHLRLVDAARPRWTFIENPEGLLKSHDGRDMAAVLHGLVELGYGVAYRVVDGGSLGSAQRRRRVLVVGHRGGDPRPARDVLGDTGPGVGAARPRAVPLLSGPAPVVGPQVDDTLIFRKSARPRAAISKGGYETWVPAEFANTLTGFDGGAATRQTHLLVQGGRVRTFTLTEWERLQGFPDGWTAGMKDSNRYSALGDAMLVPMAEWLGHRIRRVDAALPLIGATR